jgi:hypothetical protein
MEKLPFFIHGTSITDQATAHNVGTEHRLRRTDRTDDEIPIACRQGLQGASRIGDLDDLWDKQALEEDVAKRMALLRRLESPLSEKSYAVPVLWLEWIVATYAAVERWTFKPQQLPLPRPIVNLAQRIDTD